MGTATEHRVPEWLLERLLAGDLDEARAADVRAHLAAEPGGEARLQALKRESQAILAAHPPEAVAKEIHRRAAQARGEEALARRPSPWRLWVPALAAAALAVGVFYPTAQDPDLTALQGDVTRVKGLHPQLTVHRKTGRQVEKLEDDAPVTAGDVLQLSYNAAGEPFGIIVSVDGSGVVTLHHPTEPGRSPTLTTTGRVFLPRSYALDDAPDFERFFLITSEAPFDVEGVMGAVRELAKDKARAMRDALPLPSELSQTSVTLRKVEQP